MKKILLLFILLFCMVVFAQANTDRVNMEPYTQYLHTKIMQNWKPANLENPKYVVVSFTIAKDGTLLSKRVTKSSGSPTLDTAALKAVENSAPFKPLPEEFNGRSIPVQIKFDSGLL